eukprot:8712411-Prorocentrum_lima.AAC.1
MYPDQSAEVKGRRPIVPHFHIASSNPSICTATKASFCMVRSILPSSSRAKVEFTFAMAVSGLMNAIDVIYKFQWA